MNDVSGMPTSSFLTLAPQAISPKPSRKKLSPMVAMNRMIGSWLTRGRRTTRSMTKASATMARRVRASAMGTGTPFSMSPTRVRAEKRTMTPWAKLNTPEALKMRTKPRATREYMSPAATPPKSTSVRKVRLPAMSAKGATSTLRSSSIMGDPEIGVDDGGVGAHGIGHALGNLAAVVQDHHAIGDIHHHAHVVLDQRDGGPELVVHVEHEAAHVFLLLDVHPGHGLVEKEELGLGGEGAGQLHPLLEPVGQPARRRLANGLDLQEVDDALDGGPVRELLTTGRTPVNGVQQEGARNAELGDFERLEVGPVLAVEDDAAPLGMVEAADDVQERGLARSVGPDDGDDLSPLDVEADVAEGLDGPEVNADALDAEEWLRARARHRARSRDLLLRGPRHLGSLQVHDADVALHLGGPPVLVRHGGADRHRGGVSIVEGGDDGRILLIDEPATDLPGSRDLGGVGIQLLVQDGKAPDALRGRQGVIGATDLLVDQLIGGGILGKVGIARIADAASLRPVAHDLHVDVEHRRDIGARMAHRHRFLDVDAELELVLDVLGGEHRAVLQRGHVLDAIDDDELSIGIEEAGIAGMEPPIAQRRGRLLRALVIAREEALGADEHLAPIGELDVDAGQRRAHGLQLDSTVPVQGGRRAALGGAVELLEVDTDGPEELHHLGTEGGAPRDGRADAPKPELIAKG